MKENFEYTAEIGFGNWDMGKLRFGRDRKKRMKGTAEMGFGNWDLVEIGQKGRRERLRWDLGIGM